MISDIRTVMWKERRSLPLQGRRRIQLIMTVLVPLAMSIWLPWDAGPDFASGYMPSFLVSFALPVLLVGTLTPDFFAGERERKTLETLLSSRLPDRAIVLGKLFVAVAYGWIAVIATLIVGLVVVNAAHWEGSILLYTPSVLLANLALGLLISALTASLGMLISLRAKGVQEAQQILTMVLILPPMIAGFAIFALIGRFRERLASLDADLAVTVALLALAALCVLLIWMALHRFHRGDIDLG